MSRTESRRPARPPRAVGWWFHEVAPLSPLANLVAVPWVGLVVVPPALAGAWAPEPLATVAVFGGDRAVGALAWVLPWLAVSPWVLGFGPVGAALAALVLVVPRRQVVLPALAVALLGVREARPELVVTFLDVGQGDAALVEWPDGRRWLVDGGPPSDAVLSWLRRRGVGFLDVVVASHGHLGGLVPVLEELAVGELWVEDSRHKHRG